MKTHSFIWLYEETKCIYPIECIEVLLGYAGKVMPQDYREIMQYCGEKRSQLNNDSKRETTAVTEAMKEKAMGTLNLRSSILKHSK